MSRILCYGSLNLDYVYQVPHFLQPGETLASTRRDVVCGGKGLNQAIAAARAGAQVFQAGKTGAEGQILRDTLVNSGVDVTLLAKSNGPGGHTFIRWTPADKTAFCCTAAATRTFSSMKLIRFWTGSAPVTGCCCKTRSTSWGIS